MSVLKALPKFGGKKNNPAYYASVDSIVGLLRPAATLRTIAEALNTAGFLSPSGLSWTRERVSCYIRQTNTI